MATFILCLPQNPTQFYFKDPVRIWLPKHENNKGSTKSENLDVFSHSLWLRNLNETVYVIPVVSNLMLSSTLSAGT